MLSALEIACGHTEQRSKLCSDCNLSLEPSQLLAYVGNDDEAETTCAHCGASLEDTPEDKGETTAEEIYDQLHSESPKKTREEFPEDEETNDYDTADAGVEGEFSTVVPKVKESQEDWPQNFAGHDTCPHCHRKATALEIATRGCCNNAVE
jgi:hypothetical protein